MESDCKCKPVRSYSVSQSNPYCKVIVKFLAFLLKELKNNLYSAVHLRKYTDVLYHVYFPNHYIRWIVVIAL